MRSAYREKIMRPNGFGLKDEYDARDERAEIREVYHGVNERIHRNLRTNQSRDTSRSSLLESRNSTPTPTNTGPCIVRSTRIRAGVHVGIGKQN